jgi:hypothetical protein
MDPGANEEGAMGLSRRSFLQASAGVAAAGALVGVPKVASANETSHRGPSAAGGRKGAPPVSGPLVIYVHDASTGDMTIMAGTAEIDVQDQQLAARAAQAGAGAPAQDQS